MSDNTKKGNGNTNYLKFGSDQTCKELTAENLLDSSEKTENLSREIETWLTALFQSERLNVLIGSGLTIAQKEITGSNSDITMMQIMKFKTFDKALKKEAKSIAKSNGRKKANIEDQINAVNILLAGLKIYKEEAKPSDLDTDIKNLKKELKEGLEGFIKNILEVEKSISNQREEVEEYLIPFLMSFATRTSSKERLHIFTTNYDRCIEWGADLAGLRLIDRFIGSIQPTFRSSRLNIDMHYNPPGIRGEPRYLEGVAYFTKLHGSLDWCYKDNETQKMALPFGTISINYKIPAKQQRLIYPNSAKDEQTNNYPYAELFRDFATAICRPNTTLVTYGYGFGDEHINRIIKDMLTIPSTHLVIISYDDPNGIILNKFYEKRPEKEQVTVLIGNVLGDLKNLVDLFLPKSSINPVLNRMFKIERDRAVPQQPVTSPKEENSNQEKT